MCVCMRCVCVCVYCAGKYKSIDATSGHRFTMMMVMVMMMITMIILYDILTVLSSPGSLLQAYAPSRNCGLLSACH